MWTNLRDNKQPRSKLPSAREIDMSPAAATPFLSACPIHILDVREVGRARSGCGIRRMHLKPRLDAFRQRWIWLPCNSGRQLDDMRQCLLYQPSCIHFRGNGCIKPPRRLDPLDDVAFRHLSRPSVRRISLRHVRLLRARLPFVEQPSNIAIGKVDIGQFRAQVDGFVQIVGSGATDGQFVEDFFAIVYLSSR
jgi:hypothetical protein